LTNGPPCGKGEVTKPHPIHLEDHSNGNQADSTANAGMLRAVRNRLVVGDKGYLRAALAEELHAQGVQVVFEIHLHLVATAGPQAPGKPAPGRS
jgi:hypothetical protein